jgi:hypothetical protein
LPKRSRKGGGSVCEELKAETHGWHSCTGPPVYTSYPPNIKIMLAKILCHYFYTKSGNGFPDSVPPENMCW